MFPLPFLIALNPLHLRYFVFGYMVGTHKLKYAIFNFGVYLPFRFSNLEVWLFCENRKGGGFASKNPKILPNF